jgi:hypothetical protein
VNKPQARRPVDWAPAERIGGTTVDCLLPNRCPKQARLLLIPSGFAAPKLFRGDHREISVQSVAKTSTAAAMLPRLWHPLRRASGLSSLARDREDF